MPVSRIRWLRQLIPPLLAATLLTAGSAGGIRAASYQASIDVNTTAFNPPCDGDANFIVPKMQKAATAAYARLGHVATSFTGAAFNRAATLKRTVSDWGYYVHSHGDYYWHSTDARRYTGFREDSGDCSQAVVYSKDIKAKRLGRQSNLVFISTCHASDSVTTMPGAFAIEKTKSVGGTSQGPEFYVGYVGVRWDSDEWIFEQRFWNALANNRSAGAAFDIAMQGSFNDGAFDADWWGTYSYGGVAGPWTVCQTCS
jgi:hypothetical protein